ncbi:MULTISPECIES: polyphosphate polymerase domain-containing protein [Brevibacterium]|uniref:VTC domain-containing protein n=2 Tax=Brevibacterium antiquum TaxID=234835 RepID=A0A2H1KX83_9MICO|nr:MULTISPECIES: polyphosphate polymerase domain-containing protein [Brevibacterium]SMX93213.1 VTC domain-containing protein [Brevibacterium antiquum]SMY03832.1 VTC domain-containing protein [Brevibacterium antiquum CNRZ 918]HCG54708.1 VTC domain-containing protein [Brevibacterium sp.]
MTLADHSLAEAVSGRAAADMGSADMGSVCMGSASMGTGGLDAQLERIEPISLGQLNEQARLMTRIDRKYFLPRDLFVSLLRATENEFKVLQIGQKKRFEYRTIYFDSPQFRFFRDHVQGRRHRFKVRTRTYMETGTCHLEVKSKGYRGQTVKERIAHPIDSPGTLSESDHDFIDSIIGGGSGRTVSANQLEPVLETIYDRITLCHDQQRLTCDLDIRAINDEGRHDGPHDVLVETKSAGGGGVWDTLLKQRGVRPHKVSKYCVAASLLYPELPSNPWKQTIKRYFA